MSTSKSSNGKPPTEIPLTSIVSSPTNPRKKFDEAKLAELAESIKAHGVLQAVLVRPQHSNKPLLDDFTLLAEIAGADSKPASSSAANKLIDYGIRTWGELKKRTLAGHGQSTMYAAIRTVTGVTAAEAKALDAAIEAMPAEGPRKETFELVAGERRFRAAELAGLATIPVTVRDLSDKDVLEIQVIENEQREDISPLEKAEGYAALIEQHGVKVEDLAGRVGKSVSTIRGLMRLRQLPVKAHKGLEEGVLSATVAELIASRPSETMREEVAKYALQPDWHDRRPAYRQVKDYVREHCMIELKQAPFSQKDAELLPSAGACTSCPKRTGNARDEYPDGRADICADPGCYREKLKAWQERTAAAAKDAGQEVLTGKAAEKALSYGGGYYDLAEECYDVPKHSSYKKLVGEDLKDKTVLAFDAQGELHRLVSKDDALPLLKSKHGLSDLADKTTEQVKQDRAKRARESKLRTATERAILAAAAEGVAVLFRNWSYSANATLTDSFFRCLCMHNLHYGNGGEEIAARRGIKGKRRSDLFDELDKQIQTMTGHELLGLLAELLAYRYLVHGGINAEIGKPLRAVLGIDTKRISQRVKDEAKAKKSRPATPEEVRRGPPDKNGKPIRSAKDLRAAVNGQADREAKPELIDALGVTEKALSDGYIADKFCKSKITKPEAVKPFHLNLDGRFWVNTGGLSHGEHREWEIAPLYTLTEYRAKFGVQPTKLVPYVDEDSRDREQQRAEFYTGVLVSYRGETYAIGPHAEERLLTNGKPRPTDAEQPDPTRGKSTRARRRKLHPEEAAPEPIDPRIWKDLREAADAHIKQRGILHACQFDDAKHLVRCTHCGWDFSINPPAKSADAPTQSTNPKETTDEDQDRRPPGRSKDRAANQPQPATRRGRAVQGQPGAAHKRVANGAAGEELPLRDRDELTTHPRDQAIEHLDVSGAIHARFRQAKLSTIGDILDYCALEAEERDVRNSLAAMLGKEEKAIRVMAAIAAVYLEDGTQHCRECFCTADRACETDEGPCSWTEGGLSGLCSACATKAVQA